MCGLSRDDTWVDTKYTRPSGKEDTASVASEGWAATAVMESLHKWYFARDDITTE
jgi:hypothetical protein